MGSPIDQGRPVWGVLLVKDNQYGGVLFVKGDQYGVLLIKDDQYGESY